jgi:hypothetical protein
MSMVKHDLSTIGSKVRHWIKCHGDCISRVSVKFFDIST